MSEPPAKNHRLEPPWKRQWKQDATWSARELAKLCCGWDPDTGWDPHCDWEPYNSGEDLFDESDVVRWTYEAALAKIRRAWRLGDLQAVDLPEPPTDREIACDDIPVFRSREAAARAATPFPDFPFQLEDLQSASTVPSSGAVLPDLRDRRRWLVRQALKKLGFKNQAEFCRAQEITPDILRAIVNSDSRRADVASWTPKVLTLLSITEEEWNA